MTDMFEITNEAVATLVELAMVSEIADPISWDNLNITEEQAVLNLKLEGKK